MGTADKRRNGPRETARRRARRGTWSDSRRAAHRTHPSPPLPSRRPPSPPPAPWAPGTPPPTSSTLERNPPLSLSPLAVAGASRSACGYYAPTFRVDYIVLMYSAPLPLAMASPYCLYSQPDVAAGSPRCSASRLREWDYREEAAQLEGTRSPSPERLLILPCTVRLPSVLRPSHRPPSASAPLEGANAHPDPTPAWPDASWSGPRG